MGGSSGQVTGYRHFTNLLLFIGNPIEKMLGINFDKRGWISPFVDENGNALAQGVINSPNLYGENEGGVAGTVHVQYGRDDQEVLPFYKAYMDSKELPASAFPYQSYLAFTGLGAVNNTGLIGGVVGALIPQYNNAFYVGNSGYMKEMLLWPKRIHVRNDGRPQWYDLKAEINKEIFYNAVDFELIPFDFDYFTTKTTGDVETTSDVNYRSYPGNGLIISNEFTTYFSTSINEITTQYGVSIYMNKPPELVGFVKMSAIITASGVDIKIDPVFSCTCVEFKIIKTSDNGVLKQYSLDAIVKCSESMRIGVSVIAQGSVYDSANAIHQIGANISGFNVFEPKSEFIQYIESMDINPIHKIREILTDDTAMNKPESSVNDVDFRKAADRIYSEGLGISWSITEKSCMDAINELCYHIEAGIRVNRQTGLYEMVLFRDNWFEEGEIHAISESKIKSMQYEITNADEVINQVNVNYYDRANIKNSSFSISESGLIQTLGRVNAETLDFPYFMNMRNAEIVANWKLKQLSTGAFKGSFTTGWREARKWNRYDLIRLPWSKRWTGTILVRIMSINLGGPTNNEVTIEFIEVVPATGMMNTTIVIDDPVNTQPELPKPCNAKVFELPYFEAVQAFGERNVNIELTDSPEAGYLCAIAEKPQNNSLNAALYTDSGNGFERVATINYCETAYLDQAIDRMSSAFVVKNVGNIASVRVGSRIFINDETMVYESYDAETKILTVKRGALDAIPQNHTADSILYFADDFVAVDQALYVEGELINAKVLTTTPSGLLPLSGAVTHGVEFNARAIRPYPPANVKINGEYWPEIIETDLILTWVDRNRLQQTGGEILGWYEGGVTLESNVSYRIIIRDADQNIVFLEQNIGTFNSYTLDISSIEFSTISIELIAERDGYQSLHTFKHTLTKPLSAPYDLQAVVS
ncbi:hypothetical protein HLH10_04960 [Acinetobacter sp. ANC 4277]|uniref:phage tail protein n=1 Tax=Acinetobacter terrae TaxID=2731247 RepID=UPI00148F612A|nr:phage tail protein [Acinetobacter terrae]NNG75684.1 hypothetical protein [Acinetobacter terrae]